MKPLGLWIKSGTPWVWLIAGAVSVSLVMVIGLLVLIAVRGLTQFWPYEIDRFEFSDANGEISRVIGELVDTETVSAAQLIDVGYPVDAVDETTQRYLYKIGNRDISGLDFRWFPAPGIKALEQPSGLAVIEREEWGNLYGSLVALRSGSKTVRDEERLWPAALASLARRHELKSEIRHIEKDVIGAINFKIERLRLTRKKLALDGVSDPNRFAALDIEEDELNQDYAALGDALAKLYTGMSRDVLIVRIADGQEIELPLSKVVRMHRPNDMGLGAKTVHYFAKLWAFIVEDPREANTEGGIFPAIFGTVMMVMIMSVFVTPFGVVAAVYLHEYAKQGTLTRLIRIAVNNLAGVPSIVYGVFGLGFFVYFVGGSIDELFYPEALPAPTFGTPGILWSSITLAILTVPVVIVATEEGLSRIPRAIREGSLALGATKAETLWRTVLPMATPAMITGLILAVARAAGEVAPLMMVGVVKLAPSLPMDGNYPYLHLDRKFMHLGFHIYDVGFQSPNVEAARPLVYATALLLVIIIVVLNLAAIRIRNNLRDKYSATDS